ncbi:hypothetical protein [Actibacterium lipolyticum]|uniref:Uncharacterized protein n=1 Tax=Actibacterium lipolyticum TaxID=1524263 RepID=A0A238JJX9_9RHOB|nr:hypothetical protein [Actibacterium lipolyticum]SMX30959.1 hypothetical protein COL8621_00206 [Actibacterium lipolyticum]
MEKSWKIIDGHIPADLRQDLETLIERSNEIRQNYPDPMVAPWGQFPTIPPRSIGWRMGPGEDYFLDFHDWFKKLSREEQTNYCVKNPEPAGWAGFYTRIQNTK